MKPVEWNKTALLVIDMQKAFTEPGQPLCVAGAAATIPAIIKTVSIVRQRGGKIVWVRREYASDGSDMEAFRREQMKASGTLGIMAPGSYGTSPSAGLEAERGDHIVIKKRFSGFFETDLRRYLNENDISTVIAAGTQTPNCVRATAFDALSCDYRTIVAADCTSSADEAVQRNNLADMWRAGIEVVPSFLEVSASVDIRQAEPGDAGRALAFYYRLIDDMQGTRYCPKWTKGLYPVMNDILPAADAGDLFLAEENGDIAGAFILNHNQPEEYRSVRWSYASSPEHTAVLHLLATAAFYQGRGLGRKMLSKAVDVSRSRGDSVIRLDTTFYDAPAHKLYEDFGFRRCDDTEIYYPTTGKIPFRMYEYLLSC